jgi:hypothetical protein
MRAIIFSGGLDVLSCSDSRITSPDLVEEGEPLGQCIFEFNNPIETLDL